MKNILITGGTGLIGTALTELLLQSGHHITILSRHPSQKNARKGISYAHWDWEKGILDEEAVLNADHIIHLAGAGVVNKRWNERYKKEIVDSRVLSARLIVDLLMRKKNRVQSILSCSATGWYGPDQKTSHPFVETDPPCNDFLGTTCVAWENVWNPLEGNGLKICKVRTGIVLSTKGGALSEFIKPIRWGLAAILGHGNQRVSWIHINDLVRIYQFLLETQKSGIYNAVAPNPVTNRTLTLAIAKKMRKRRFISIKVPALFLKLMMGESSIEVLKSTTVSADKLVREGFNFEFVDIQSAMDNLLSK
jgi:uncharacterized protein (TIGR01777 family)